MRYATIIGFIIGGVMTLLYDPHVVTASRPQGVVPQRAVTQHRLRPIADTKGFGVPAERVWVRGQDGKAYRLSDVIKALFER